jgi:hypothetical protein
MQTLCVWGVKFCVCSLSLVGVCVCVWEKFEHRHQQTFSATCRNTAKYGIFMCTYIGI